MPKIKTRVIKSNNDKVTKKDLSVKVNKTSPVKYTTRNSKIKKNHLEKLKSSKNNQLNEISSGKLFK